jgi:hypothetical protein
VIFGLAAFAPIHRIPETTMPSAADADWAEIERLVREGRPYTEISRQTGLSPITIGRRAVREGWRASAKAARAAGAGSSLAARRALIHRFYAAINKKLRQMERRLADDIECGGGAASATDHEREVRTIGGLIAHLGTLSEFEAELDRPAGKPDAGADRAGESDRYREELATLLSRLVPPQS